MFVGGAFVAWDVPLVDDGELELLLTDFLSPHPAHLLFPVGFWWAHHAHDQRLPGGTLFDAAACCCNGAAGGEAAC